MRSMEHFTGAFERIGNTRGGSKIVTHNTAAERFERHKSAAHNGAVDDTCNACREMQQRVVGEERSKVSEK